MADAAPFLNLLKLLRVPGENLRIAWADDHQFKAPPLPYAEIPAFLDHAETNALNVWFEVQPSRYTAAEGRSKAGDIIRLAALYADIDYKPMPGGMGSHAGATDLIRDLTGALGAPPAATVYSGHGAQPYWLIEDAPVDDDSRNRVASILRRFGGLVKQFAQANHGDVDNVFDLPRILRVPGSVNWKRRDTPIPTSVEFAAEPVRFTLDEIEQVLDDYEVPDQEIEVGIGIVSPEAAWEWADQDCDFAFTIRREIGDSIPHSRHHWALKQAAIVHGLIRNGCVTEATFYELRDLLIGKFEELCATQAPVRKPTPGEIRSIVKWGLGQAEGWSDKKLAEETRQHIHGDFSLGFRAPLAQGVSDSDTNPADLTTGEIRPSNVINLHDRSRHDPVFGSLALAPQVTPHSQERMFLASATDTGNAERLASHLKGLQIYVTPGMGWHEWDGSRYVPDTAGTVMERTKDLFVDMLHQATEPDAVKWARSSLNQSRLNATIKLAQSVPNLVTSTMDLDANGYELCTPGGIVDLWSGTLRPADPMIDRHTYRAAYTPDFGMPTPRWDGFLRWAMGEDGEGDPLTRVNYLQRLAGAAAIGKLLWHVFPIGVGVGANGKACSTVTPMLTTRGWTTMGDLRVGDQVFGSDGRPTTITYTSPVMYDHTVYRVTTRSGATVDADAEHLWTTAAGETLTTQAMLDRGLVKRERPKGNEFRFALPRTPRLDTPAVDLPLDPWLLGYWLGNGDTAGSGLTVNLLDAERVQERIEAAGLRFGRTRDDRGSRSLRPLKMLPALRDLDVLGNKHIPERYLLAGTQQRLELLRGLLDSDGYCSLGQGQVEFVSVRRELAEQVLYLIRSLGWKVTIKEGVAKLNGRVTGPKFRVTFTPNVDDDNPFSFPRKAARVRSTAKHVADAIVSIIEVPTVPVRCIQVDADDRLYLAGRDLMVTHNTTFQEVLMGCFGDYGTVMPKRFLEEKRNAEHPTEIAQLRGVRFAAHSEVSPRASFDEQLVKMLTGEPRLRGRFVNENYFTFPNQTTHFLVANHLPTVQVGGTGFFRRVRKIDFRNQMPTLRQNERLVGELLGSEGPGIMAWIIRGAQAALLGGLNDPAEVLTSTREYQLEEDAMARFLDETVTSTSAGPGIQRDVLYSLYRQWCSRLSEPAVPFTKWQRDVVLLWPGANQGTRGVFTGMAMRAMQYVEETEA